MTALPEEEGDAEIIRRLQAGEVRGLELLLETHGGQVKRWLRSAFRRREGDHALEDAVHDAARSLLRYAKRLKPELGLRGYYYKTARNAMLRILKQQSWHPTLVDGAEHEIPAPTGEPAVTCDLSKRIAAVIDGLPELERDILMLDVAHGFSMPAAEVAKLTGTTLGTVYALRNRSKGRLRPLLDPDLPPGEGSS